ncbi:tetratricopeptide (TPR) repeat protein [Variovorax boronicumulans]|uniref:tetratricopeptide repeat protein n=1 Tax=Variovorax boronicumulans TaxID=436515 RepID=UPI00277E2A41|nr:tetratricopeptide repeat protein [Variovorax boronicumulans]MDQ0035036.1 tetratricopeptide (TPR) repeat protein [Variovorax boronicumulans]
MWRISVRGYDPRFGPGGGTMNDPTRSRTRRALAMWSPSRVPRFAAVLALGCTSLLPTAPATAQSGNASPAAAAGSSAVEVVSVSSTFGGVVVAPALVATPCHRMGASAPPFSVRQGQNQFPAELIAADEDRNVCLLQARGLNAPAAQMGRTRDSSTLGSVHAMSLQEGLLRRIDLHVPYLGKVVDGLYLGVAQPLVAPPAPLRDGVGIYNEQGQLLAMVVMESADANALSMALPVEWIGSVLERKPRAPASLGTTAWMNQARIFDAKGDAAGLLENNLRWAEAQPRSAWAWNNLGNAHMSSGGKDRTTKAVEAYLKAVELDPQLAPAWNNLGNVYSETRRSPLAIEAYQTATRVDPGYGIAWRNLGELYRKNGQQDRAIDALKQAAKAGTGGERAIALNGLAFIYGEGPQAIQALQEAVTAEPRFGLGWKNLGIAWERTGDRQRAIKAYEIALRIDPRDGVAWTRLGDAYTWTKQPDAALQAYRAATALEPGNGAAWKWQGVQYLERKDYKQAIPALTEALKNGESNAFVYEELGKAFQENGQASKAEESFLKAIELAPLNAMPSMRLSELYRKLGRPDESLRLAESAVKLAPTDARAWDLLGTVRSGKGQLQEAIQAYQRAVALDPKMPTAWINLGLHLNAAQQIPQAKEALTQALRIEPDNRAALINMGVSHIRSGEPAAAVSIFERLDVAKPSDPLVLANLCAAYKRAGRIDDAIKAYGRLHALDRNMAGKVYEQELKGLAAAIQS